jgi:hypothetical protein
VLDPAPRQTETAGDFALQIARRCLAPPQVRDLYKGGCCRDATIAQRLLAKWKAEGRIGRIHAQAGGRWASNNRLSAGAIRPTLNCPNYGTNNFGHNYFVIDAHRRAKTPRKIELWNYGILS